MNVDSCGGNLLINVGPTSAGIISPIFEERLRQLGEWLGVNGEAIYASKPWKAQNDTLTKDIWYATRLQCRSSIIEYTAQRLSLFPAMYLRGHCIALTLKRVAFVS